MNGDVAIIDIEYQSGSISSATVRVVDGGPVGSGLDTIAWRGSQSDVDCADTGFGTPEPIVIGGDIVVHDAPALPTSKDHCKNEGWRTYGIFKNQGDCVSFVATGGKNPPAGSTQP